MLTIDELARQVGMTTRNIRAHQTRGLLPPPRLQGRTGRYDREHVERLRQITRLQDEGLNLQAITLVLDGGRSREFARVRQAVLEPWATEEPIEDSIASLSRRLDEQVDADVLRRAIDLGVVEPVDAETVRVVLPALIRTAEAMLRLGVPLGSQTVAVEQVDANVRDIAGAFIALAREHLASALVGDDALDPDAVRGVVEELRGIAAQVLLTLFHRAMTQATDRLVSEVLDAAVD